MMLQPRVGVPSSQGTAISQTRLGVVGEAVLDGVVLLDEGLGLEEQVAAVGGDGGGDGDAGQLPHRRTCVSVASEGVVGLG